MTTSAEAVQRTQEGFACYCSGAPYPETDLVRLSCHFEVGLCRHCLGWLNRRMRAKRFKRTPLGPSGTSTLAVARAGAAALTQAALQPVRVTLVYFDGCPNWQATDAALREAMRRTGIEVAVEYRRTESEQEAQDASFQGSPTLQISPTADQLAKALSGPHRRPPGTALPATRSMITTADTT
jgi:hypothetical protein